MENDPQAMKKLRKPRASGQIKTVRKTNQVMATKLATLFGESIHSKEQLQQIVSSPNETNEVKLFARQFLIALYSEDEAKSLKATELLWNRLYGKIDLIVTSKKTVQPDDLPDSIEELEAIVHGSR